ncbi:Uncharacterised protein [Streptococcus pneumoniae]|jgi:hypothetical protein|uniref:Uncharacterized protein n=3 Tax=Stutzerimonas TaxID=2901164 RepID=A0A0D7DYY4_STUST|nr:MULTISPECIES: hypothetical protein [Pseudomonadaceae]WAD28917.1 hypothetical protein OS670_20750 [Pseudomonadaceae bacterium T75]CJL78405.1 Uncharacterised protein [Streptococcus pneumoniae]KIZ33410.1 hypothetical protein LO50_20935 [Stutzerimonas stutzeri]KZX55906.1 hypothetical protein A3710_22160 [Stutzerimonas frequens]MBA1265416.1 hypothetical protein [Stutzerimonas stutzeri]
MMDRKQAIDFAIRSARIGVDQGQVADYRDNVRDTLNDEGASEWDQIADDAFTAEVARLQPDYDAAMASWEEEQDNFAWEREQSAVRRAENGGYPV